MPNITLTVTSEQASRIQAYLSSTPYPTTLAGVKTLLIDYLNSQVKEYEKNKTNKEALELVVKPVELEIT